MSTTLNWEHYYPEEPGEPEEYTADSEDRTYIVRTFHPAEHDGDVRLPRPAHEYPADCWILIRWVGDTTKGPHQLFDNLGDALLAAQTIEDREL